MMIEPCTVRSSFRALECSRVQVSNNVLPLECHAIYAPYLMVKEADLVRRVVLVFLRKCIHSLVRRLTEGYYKFIKNNTPHTHTYTLEPCKRVAADANGTASVKCISVMA